MSETMTYTVPAIHCSHCEAAIKREVEPIDGVKSVEVDLEHKLVRISGDGLEDPALRAAIDEAGFEVA
ncbi:heavy-metal-associated domain-containing protein [Conexibacter sp. DBS9H8]|uniref:heavy-metal-associated domain-containing protein n=1 Tax=Conexibacter sp. DBS9H8 TaxID=2937801 RepID=UPI00200BF3B2|nr:heavy-metal-associated domain-containing protein [Conexibacter sp. DBS9H8]